MSGLSSFKAFVEAVRDRSDLVEVIGRDVELRRVGNVLKGLSPFHPEKHASFVVWPATQSWHDYSNGGGLGGDVFTYVQEREKVGFKDAVLLLADRAGLRSPNQSDAAWKRSLALANERREIERLLTAAATYYHRALPPEIRDRYFRQHYGFTDDTIDQLQLGWADGQLFEHLTRTAGAPRRMALGTGLFVPLPGGRVVDFFRNRLVFPYWRGGRVVYFTARATEHTGDEPREQAKYKKLRVHGEQQRYISPTVRNDYFFNEGAARGAEELVITEGVPDCISALQCGVACISPGTTSLRGQDIPRLLELTRQAKRIIICNDSEVSGAGDASATAIAASLWAEGREVCIASIPRPDGVDKIDLNELVVAHGAEELRAVLVRALPYPEFLLARIPGDAPKSELGRLLEPVLAAITRCSSIRADVVLDAITAKFGLRRRALTEAMKQIGRAQQEAAVGKEAAKTTAGSPSSPATPPRSTAAACPEINIHGRQRKEVVREAGVVLTQVNERRMKAAVVGSFEKHAAPLFIRGESLVRLRRPRKSAPMLMDVSEAVMHGMLMREVDWVKVTDAGAFPVPPPKEIAVDILALPPSSIPEVESVITTPTFGGDGRLLRTPGLHASDLLWLEPDPALQLAEIPDRPTPQDIAAARSLFFEDLLVDFPFVSPSDRAHALAALLLPFVRRLIDGCTPLHLVEAPARGAGKGLLCNLVSILTTGGSCVARTLPESDEEIRKMLTAELATGRPIILLDNANDKQLLASASLASVLTTQSWTDRILGRTEMITVPNKAMWVLTGNNPKLSKDIVRRSVRIRIDPKVDRAWLRASFKHRPLLTWVREHRGELVRAALVLVQAWIAAGRPLSRAQLGSFEEWSMVMGGVFEVAGVEGFLGNLDELYEHADAEGQAWREFTQAWWEEHGDDPITVSVLAELCDRLDLMSLIRGDGSARSQQSRLGRALQGARDRVFGELQVVVGTEDRKKRTLYALRRVEAEPGLIEPSQPGAGMNDGGDD